MGRKWGVVPFGEAELGPHLTQCGQGRGYLCAKFHLDPSNRLATVHQCYRQERQTEQTDRQTGQWSGSIGRTVLQMVAQKRVWRSHCKTCIIVLK